MNDEPQASLTKRLKWRAEWLGQTAAESIVARLPGPFVFRLGSWIGRLLWRLMRQRRITVEKNLRVAQADEKSLEEIRELARASFIRTVANLLSAVHTAHLSAEVLESRVTVENPELLAEAVANGRGCVLLPPHMGNWEILARISRVFPAGHPQGALYRPLNNPHLDARLTARRRSEGTRMFSKRDSLLEISKFLKEGGIIGILADQRAGPQGVLTNFFARLTRSSPLPYLLIRRCKVPAFSISVRTVRPGYWALRYHPVAAPADTQACMDAIEQAMRISLIDVFWFQDRWKCFLDGAKSIHDWLGDADQRSTGHPHRALLWLPDAPADFQLPAAWQHPDVKYELAIPEGMPPPAWAKDHATRIHQVAPGGGDARQLGEALRTIDRASPLPLDFVLSPRPHAMLHQACRRRALMHAVISRR